MPRSILVRITARDDSYDDVHPQLMLEDAFDVQARDWPEGFDLEVVDPTPPELEREPEPSHPA